MFDPTTCYSLQNTIFKPENSVLPGGLRGLLLDMNLDTNPARKDFRLGLIGPLPPPSGGMANQTKQLAELLSLENIFVVLLQVNKPYKPDWIKKIRGLRALFRLLPYLVSVLQGARQVDLFHIMANSGWSWHLYAVPAVWIARIKGIPAVINYRGGGAEYFLQKSSRLINLTLRQASSIIVPSGFLKKVFSNFEIKSSIIPNIIDLHRFRAADSRHENWVKRTGNPSYDTIYSDRKSAGRENHYKIPHIIVTRNLEKIYDNQTALRSFQLIRRKYPNARMSIAGSGSEISNLNCLAKEIGVSDSVTFTGRLDNKEIASLYRSADLMINPSLVDNMPISILEALACGVPVISTNVGGVPYLVQDRVNSLLVPPGDYQAMAKAAIEILGSESLADKLSVEGLKLVKKFTWPVIREQWLQTYRELI